MSTTLTPDPRNQRVALYTYGLVLRLAQRISGLAAPLTVAALGLDVSHWQTSVNWQTAKSKQIKYAFIRALYGLTLDTRFELHWLNSKIAGIPRGAYLYYKDNLDPIQQAQKLYDTLAATGDLGELPPVLDVESISNPTLTAWKIKQCCEKLTQLFGRKPIIYTGFYVWRDSVTGNKDWAAAYELWIAGYPFSGWKPEYLQTVLNYPPLIPAPWTDCAVWQWTASAPAAEYGVSGNFLDLDYCSPAFAAKYLSAPPPPAEGDLMKNGKAIIALVNIRNIHAKSGSVDGGDLLNGDTFKFYPTDTWTKPDGTEIWWHIKTDKVVLGSPVVGWAAYKHPDFNSIGGYGLQEIA